MQIVFQDPFSSLNPRMKVGAILDRGHGGCHLLPVLLRPAKIAELLDQVGLPADAAGPLSARIFRRSASAHRHRPGIGGEPKLLILDEPTSALDVSVQAQILNLLADLQRQHGLAYLFITHNLSVVSYLAHRVAVMRGGRVVESGPAETDADSRPENAYTKSAAGLRPGQEAAEPG
jgi:peptide/nickel transport system ATP-binding protein